MCEAENITNDVNEFVRLLGKIRGPLEMIYIDEMNRIRQEEDAWERNPDEQPPFENV